jgi:hypothetical protein
MTHASVVVRARDFYAIYMASCRGLNYEGKPCPQWQDLNDAALTAAAGKRSRGHAARSGG